MKMTDQQKEKIIHSFFKIQRKSRGLTLVKMAQLLEISPRNYWNLENNSLSIQKRTMDKVAEKLGFHPVEVFYPDIDIIEYKLKEEDDTQFNFFLER